MTEHADAVGLAGAAERVHRPAAREIAAALVAVTVLARRKRQAGPLRNRVNRAAALS